MPVFPTLRGSPSRMLRVDVLAGLAAGSVVIPQAMSYATVAGLPVEFGLYTCMLPMVVYAAFGGSPTLSVSTTSTIAILVSITVADDATDTQDLLDRAFTLTVLVGVLLVAARLLRLAGLVENISPATLTGVKAGVGLTVAATQLPVLLGVPDVAERSSFVAEVDAVLGQLGDVSGITLAVSATSVAVLLVARKLVPAVPAPLLVVGGGILLVALTDVADRGLALIDEVPSGFPDLSLPHPALVVDLLPGALAIATMAFLETSAVARGVRRRDEPRIDSEQELLAIGLASLAGGFTQSLPPAGGFSQTAVEPHRGGHSVAGRRTGHRGARGQQWPCSSPPCCPTCRVRPRLDGAGGHTRAARPAVSAASGRSTGWRVVGCRGWSHPPASVSCSGWCPRSGPGCGRSRCSSCCGSWTGPPCAPSRTRRRVSLVLHLVPSLHRERPAHR